MGFTLRVFDSRSWLALLLSSQVGLRNAHSNLVHRLWEIGPSGVQGLGFRPVSAFGCAIQQPE